MGRKRSRSARFRVGKVTGYLHHGAWWLYYREDGKTARRKVALNRDDAEKLAAQINGQAAAGTPTLLSFDSIGVGELRKQFLEYHELALKSSMGTVRRYRAARQHLEDFVTQQPKALQAHQVRPGQIATYLRKIEVAPNGHKNTAKRKLRDKGVQFILETCRSMYTFALKNQHLPPYTGNPFSELPLDRFKIEDAKPIFVFTENVELAFFKSASDWTLAAAMDGFTGADIKRLVEDGKLLFANDKVRTRALRPAMTYNQGAIREVRANKERYVEADAQARKQRPRPSGHLADGGGCHAVFWRN